MAKEPECGWISDRVDPTPYSNHIRISSLERDVQQLKGCTLVIGFATLLCGIAVTILAF